MEVPASGLVARLKENREHIEDLLIADGSLVRDYHVPVFKCEFNGEVTGLPELRRTRITSCPGWSPNSCLNGKTLSFLTIRCGYAMKTDPPRSGSSAVAASRKRGAAGLLSEENMTTKRVLPVRSVRLPQVLSLAADSLIAEQDSGSLSAEHRKGRARQYYRRVRTEVCEKFRPVIDANNREYFDILCRSGMDKTGKEFQPGVCGQCELRLQEEPGFIQVSK